MHIGRQKTPTKTRKVLETTWVNEYLRRSTILGRRTTLDKTNQGLSFCNRHLSHTVKIHDDNNVSIELTVIQQEIITMLIARCQLNFQYEKCGNYLSC